MDIRTKLKILDSIYNVYDQFIGDSDFMCEKFCSHCCTCNLTMTTLEGYRIFLHVDKDMGNKFVLDRLISLENKDRFFPSITINKMAELCSKGDELPEESISHEVGPCPGLIEKQCCIYLARPFGCRSMFSTANCVELGYASIDPYLLTVHNIFVQYIEHIDVSGYTGNLFDVILLLASSEDYRCRYENGLVVDSVGTLIKNQMIYNLMIPPEHIERVQPVLAAIRDIAV